MRVVLFGATGMVGAGVLIECLADPAVTAILVVGRRSCGVTHPKVRELLRSDFVDYADAAAELAGYDACCFSLGVSSAGMGEEQYHRLTYEITIAATEALARQNPGMTFCYVSGEEQPILMFRPGYIHPMKGVRSPHRLYRAFHLMAVPLYPPLRRVLSSHMTTTENVGRAMIRVSASGYPKRVLENPDIDRAATAA